MKKRTALLWFLTVLITLSSVVYQRLTGPTHPLRGDVTVGEETIRYKLLRTHDTDGDARIEMGVSDPGTTGELRWRRYKSFDEWRTEPLVREEGKLVATVPRQPAAGKVMYTITLIDATGARHELNAEPVVMRYKGPVPLAILIPHVLCMFTGMLLATRAGLEALVGGGGAYRQAAWTTALLVAGGLILGPIVQKLAFDAYWTGFPLGKDLTDTKTAAAVLVWVIALGRGRGNQGRGSRGWILAAAVVTLAIYLVPHSTLGSELDYTQTS